MLNTLRQHTWRPLLAMAWFVAACGGGQDEAKPTPSQTKHQQTHTTPSASSPVVVSPADHTEASTAPPLQIGPDSAGTSDALFSDRSQALGVKTPLPGWLTAEQISGCPEGSSNAKLSALPCLQGRFVGQLFVHPTAGVWYSFDARHTGHTCTVILGQNGAMSLRAAGYEYTLWETGLRGYLPVVSAYSMDHGSHSGNYGLDYSSSLMDPQGETKAVFDIEVNQENNKPGAWISAHLFNKFGTFSCVANLPNRHPSALEAPPMSYQQWHSCQDMSPMKVQNISCLVGQFTGIAFTEDGKEKFPRQPCTVHVQANGYFWMDTHTYVMGHILSEENRRNRFTDMGSSLSTTLNQHGLKTWEFHSYDAPPKSNPYYLSLTAEELPNDQGLRLNARITGGRYCQGLIKKPR